MSIEMSNQEECPVCMEIIQEKNNCKTECGHSFCLKCILICSVTKAECPCCRFVLFEKKEEEDEYESDDDESDEEGDDEMNSQASDEDTDDEDNEDNEVEGTVEEITKRFEKKGYSMVDVVSILLGRISKLEDKNTKVYFNKVNDDLEEIIFEVDEEVRKESEELNMMQGEDRVISV